MPFPDPLQPGLMPGMTDCRRAAAAALGQAGACAGNTLYQASDRADLGSVWAEIAQQWLALATVIAVQDRKRT